MAPRAGVPGTTSRRLRSITSPRTIVFPIGLPARRDRSRSEEHTSELQSLRHLVCRLLLEKKEVGGRAPPCRNLAGLHVEKFCCLPRHEFFGRLPATQAEGIKFGEVSEVCGLLHGPLRFLL